MATGTITVTISGQTAKAASNFTTLSRNELLVLGNWHYATTIRNDTVIQNGKTIWESSYPYSNLNATFDYLNFTDSGVVYSFQSAWGIGQSGKQYKDTVSYTISNNTIILTYPSGMNNLGNAFAYLSYYDTISIKALTSNYFSLTRNHHFKHYTFSSGETKQSADSLTK